MFICVHRYAALKRNKQILFLSKNIYLYIETKLWFARGENAFRPDYNLFCGDKSPGVEMMAVRALGQIEVKISILDEETSVNLVLM